MALGDLVIPQGVQQLALMKFPDFSQTFLNITWFIAKILLVGSLLQCMHVRACLDLSGENSKG